MKHCLDHPRLFQALNDPYGYGRICFKFKMIDANELSIIIADKLFSFIDNNGVIYFKQPD